QAVPPSLGNDPRQEGFRILPRPVARLVSVSKIVLQPEDAQNRTDIVGSCLRIYLSQLSVKSLQEVVHSEGVGLVRVDELKLWSIGPICKPHVRYVRPVCQPDVPRCNGDHRIHRRRDDLPKTAEPTPSYFSETSLDHGFKIPCGRRLALRSMTHVHHASGKRRTLLSWFVFKGSWPNG